MKGRKASNMAPRMAGGAKSQGHNSLVPSIWRDGVDRICDSNMPKVIPSLVG